MELRPYQKKLISRVYSQWRSGNKRVMAQCPTGGGKTICFTEIAADCVAQGKRVLILAHRQELITQAANKVIDLIGIEPGIIKAGYEPNYNALLQIGSVQSVFADSRLTQLPDFRLIIIDEAHHFNLKNSYGKILERFPNAYVLGVTATPKRLDGKGFDDYFDTLVCGVSVRSLIDLGYLCRFKLFASDRQMKTQGVEIQRGDYSLSQLAAENDVVELSGNLIDTYRTYAEGKKTIVFAINVAHSMEIANAYNRAGISAAHLDGSHSYSDRQDILQKFREGKIQVLSNCQLFTEGFDLPDLEAVQIARPTKSLSLWLQMVGRVLRPCENKDLAIILDHTDNHKIHGLPTRPRLWTLEGKPKKLKQEQCKERDNGEPLPEKDIIESQEQLLEVVSTLEEQWESVFEDLVYVQQERGYNKFWICHRLQDMEPPLYIWKMCGEYLGYKPGWAWYRYQEQQSA